MPTPDNTMQGTRLQIQVPFVYPPCWTVLKGDNSDVFREI